MRHTKERARYYALVGALYDAAVAEMPHRKRRSPHHLGRARRTAFKNAWAMSNRAQRRALGYRTQLGSRRMDIPKDAA